ncbi:hypothetical protein [Weissella bombi]|uniref:Uncharacterized protein n=1 Tax=Weissella bombi TaxID=1505725 RepID=A0A1C3ZWA5_9LACO|nr:hypothetical protein [Weissella bombi]SCB86552.1 hypothetical protein GA0061074_10320 [Weissella bombi]
MSKTKGFLAGTIFGGLVAAAGYGYYKMMTVEQQADLKAKFDDTIADVRDKVVDYSYAATDAVASVREKADDFVSDKSYAFDSKVADLKSSAEDKSAELREKADDLIASAQEKADDLRSQANDLKNKAKSGAAEVTEEDIVLSPADDALDSETFEELTEEASAEPEVLNPNVGLSQTGEKGLSDLSEK